MLNIFSHAYWPSVYLLCRNVYLSPLSVVKLSCLSFCCWVLGDFCVFLLNPYQIYDLQIFSPILWVVVLHLDNVLWFTKVLKSLLNLLQYCFCIFMLMVFCLQGMWDLSSPTRDRTHTPCIGRSLNHWTAREFPISIAFKEFRQVIYMVRFFQ